MVDISRAQPHVIRVSIVAITLLLIFLFFDPIGFASSSMADKKPGTSRSITHLVMMQFKHGADPATIDATCTKFLELKKTCLSPNSNYAYIQGISGGKDNSPEGLQHGLTHAFVINFANQDDRNYYVEQDPVHQAFKKEINGIVEKVTVLDFTNGKF